MGFNLLKNLVNPGPDHSPAKLTINAPVNLTAPCIIFSSGFFSLRGRLGP